MRIRARGAHADTLDAVLSGFVLQGLVMVSGIVAARMLGPEDRGLLALMWIVTLVLSQVGTLGVPAALAIFVGQRRCGRADVLRSLELAALQAAVVVVLQALALVIIFSGRRADALGAALVTLAALPATIAQLYALALLQGVGALRMLQILRVLPSATYAAVLTAGFAAGEATLLFAALAWTGGYVGSAAVTLVVAVRRVRRLPSSSAVEPLPTREIVRFGLRGLPGWVSPLETFRLDQLLVGLLLSAHDLGLYVVALAFTNLPRFVAQGMGQAAVARVAALTDAVAVHRAIRRHALLATAVTLSIAAPLTLLARPLVELFFGSEFSGAAPLLQVLQISTVLVCTRRVLGDGLRAAGRPSAGSVAELASYAVVVPALALGAQAGAIGIAWAVVSSSLASLMLLVALAARSALAGRRASVSVAAGARP